MNNPTENPAQRANATTGSNQRLRKHLSSTTPEQLPAVKTPMLFQLPGGVNIIIASTTRRAVVAMRIVRAGARGISAAGFDAGVRLGGIVFQLRCLRFPITTTRERVPGDPFGAVRAVYRTPLRVDADEASPLGGA